MATDTAPQSKAAAAAVAELDPALTPEHICIIMDGNHRWARQRHLPGAAGHRAGARRLREVSLLMDLMRHVMDNDIEELNRRRVRLRVIGDRSRFAPDIQARMAECEA